MLQVYTFHSSTLDNEQKALNKVQSQVNAFLCGLDVYSEEVSVQDVRVNTLSDLHQSYDNTVFRVTMTVHVRIECAPKNRTSYIKQVEELYALSAKEPEPEIKPTEPDDFDPFLDPDEQLP